MSELVVYKQEMGKLSDLKSEFFLIFSQLISNIYDLNQNNV